MQSTRPAVHSHSCSRRLPAQLRWREMLETESDPEHCPEHVPKAVLPSTRTSKCTEVEEGRPTPFS